MKEIQVLKELKNGNNRVLEEIYLNHKKPFFNYAKKFNLQKEEILDIYQDVILAFLENIKTGKITHFDSSIKTYLFSVGKYMIYNKFKKESKIKWTDSFKESDLKTDEKHSFLFQQELSSKQQLLKKYFNLLGEKCKEILTLFYFRNYSLEEITEELNYTKKDVVKSQKSRCLKSLKDNMK